MQSSYTFSPLDEIMPPLRFSLMYCFSCVDSDKEHIFSILHAGLVQMIRERPFLTAVVVQENSDKPANGTRPGHLSLDIPEHFETPELVFKDLTAPESGWNSSYEELRAAGMPLSKLDGRIFAPVPYGILAPGDRAMAFQATMVRGGCFLSGSSVHNFVDAFGLLTVMHEWARKCRMIQNPLLLESPNGHSEHYDGKAFSSYQQTSLEDYENLKHRQELWRVLGLDWRKDGFKPAPYSNPPTVNTSIFAINREAVAAIKEKATPENLSRSNSRPPSSNDALISFLWRSITKARYPQDGSEHKEQSMVSVAIDGRNALSPKIPMSHIGNVVFCGLTELPVKLLTAPETGLPEIASALRDSLSKNRRPELLADAVKLASCIPDVRKLGNAFRGWFEEDLVTTSGAEMPVYSLDFGPILGTTEFFRFPVGQFAGICMVLPRKPDGTLEVVISLTSRQMQRLVEDVEFMKYFKFVAQ